MPNAHACVIATLYQGISICLVQPLRDHALACSDKITSTFGISLPEQGRTRTAGGLTIVWAGPDSWLFIAPEDKRLEAQLLELVGSIASVVDQSDARIVLSISGSKARETLAKGVTIDLHLRAFRMGDTAITLASHLNLQLILTDDTPNFMLLASRPFAADLWHWLEASAAEFGLELRHG